MKKKFMKAFFKAVLFITIFCVLLCGISYSLVGVDPDGYSKITEFYSHPEDSLDAVYIGSSNCFAFWNPLFAWNEYGICVHPYSCNCNPYFSTEYLIKEARKTQPDATFIVNLNSISDGDLAGMRMYNLLGCMPFSFTKLELTKHLCDVSDIEGLDRLEYYLPTIHSYRFSKKSKLLSKPDGYLGAAVHPEYLEDSVDVSSLYVAPKKSVELSEKIISTTDSLLNYCDEENIEVLFVVVPQARDNEDEMNNMQSLSEYISKKGYTVLNLTESAEEMNIDMTKDYYNGGHTNIHGANKYTQYLSEYLIENYGFEDKRNNENYSYWNTAYENYMGVASSHILDIEFDYDHRDFNIEEPVFEVELKNNSAVITWNPVKGTDSYVIYKKSDSSPHWESISEVSAQSDKLQYTDNKFTKDDTSYYTVVPFATKDGITYYGDFNYSGISPNLKTS